MKTNNIVAQKSIQFAIRVVKASKFLAENKKEFILSKQLLRSGTAVGALIKEAEYAESDADFIHKMHIGLKEANEASYWLLLLKEGGFLSINAYDSLVADTDELIKLLVSIIKTLKLKLLAKRSK